MTELVVVGAGHGAGQLVVSLKQRGFDGHLTLIGDEPWLPYQRPPLSKKFLAGQLQAERLFVKPESFYRDPSLTLSLDTRVTAIVRDRRRVMTASRQALPYDTLVLATGSRPRRIELPGATLPGVFYLRTIEDVEQIRAALAAAERLVIVGAGYIGLEVAAVAVGLGVEVTVVEALDRVMSRVVSAEVSAVYERVHRQHGVDLRLGTGVSAFLGDDSLAGVQLVRGEPLDADAVIVGVGAIPNTEIAAEAGLEVADGIVVDDRCRTSDPHIYAIGDCTFHPNAVLGRSIRLESVHNALEQAKTAAINIAGGDAHYDDVPWFWSDQYDLKLQIAGISTDHDDIVVRGDMEEPSFACLYLAEQRLIAVEAVNRPRDFMQAKPLIAAHAIIARGALEDSAVELKEMEWRPGR